MFEVWEKYKPFPRMDMATVSRVLSVKLTVGRAIAQAVKRWLPIVAAQVRFRAACGVCGGQSGIGAGFL
jgi:hypothetical protein